PREPTEAGTNFFKTRKRILVQTGKKKKELKELRYVRNVVWDLKLLKRPSREHILTRICPFTGN
ncbi:hypothetical protein OS493_032979, partial [Desmophyllum pertusum]